MDDTLRTWLQRWYRRTATGLPTALCACALTVLIHHSGLLRRPEFWLYDVFLRQRAMLRPAPVVIVSIGEDDLTEGEKGRVSDENLILALKFIEENHPYVIGVDVLKGSDGEQHRELVDFLAGFDNVIMAEQRYPAKGRQVVRLPPGVDAGQGAGVDYPKDPDESIRRAWIYVGTSEKQPYSLPFVLATSYLAASGVGIGDQFGLKADKEGEYYALGPNKTRLSRLLAGTGGYVNLNRTEEYTDGGFQFLIDYATVRGSFPTATLKQLKQAASGGQSLDPRDLLKGKAVLLGYIMESEDTHVTPVMPGTPGLELNARVTDQLIRLGMGSDHELRAASWLWLGAGALLASLAAGAVGTFVHRWAIVVAAMVAGSALAIGLAFLAFRSGLWMPLPPLLLAFALSAAATRLLANRWLVVFLSYASEDAPRVAEVYRCLRAAGHDPWLDKKGLRPGEKYPVQLARAIRRSDRFLPCLSERMLEKEAASGVLPDEITQALDAWEQRLDHRQYIVPVRLEPCGLPRRLQEFQWVDFYAPHGCRSLRKALRRE